MGRIRQRAVARRDLVEHFVYLAETAGLATAERFLDAAEATFNDLADQPLMGAPVSLRSAELAAVRKWRVRGFDTVLVFYLPRPDGVSVLRVLHAARDWWRLLGLDDA
jgi:toxin ParE1/3/4